MGTDSAYRHGHSVTLRGAGIRTARAQLLETFSYAARQRGLVDDTNPGNGISPDGTSFHLVINETLYAQYQERKLSELYHQVTGRRLRFESAPRRGTTRGRVAKSDRDDGIIDTIFDFIGDVLD